MKRRDAFKVMAAACAAGTLNRPFSAYAATDQMVTVAKIIGIPWFNLLSDGITEGGKKFGIDATMTGPAHIDPAQQVSMVEDLIAKRVNVIGLVPLDVKVMGPVLKRAQEAGIIVITQEGPNQENRTWDVEMIDSTRFGETQMKALAQNMGEQGQYIIMVGTLTTPLHNKWADAAIAYQKAHYPRMSLATSRFPGSDEVDTAEQVMRNVLQAYPDVRGVIGFGSNGAIGAGQDFCPRHRDPVAGEAAAAERRGARVLRLEPEGRRLRDGGGRQPGAAKGEVRGRHGHSGPRPRQRRCRQPPDQRRSHAGDQQADRRRPDRPGSLNYQANK